MKKLELSSVALCGRSNEVDTLRDAYRSANDQSQAVLVSGYSGTGKSTLVQYLKSEILKDDSASNAVYFASGQFSQLRTREPYSALTEALNDLCDMVLQSDNSAASFKERVGSKARVLTSVVPKLSRLLGETDNKADTNSSTRAETALNQLKFLLQALIRSISDAQACPMVLFLDDLQWADVASLDLITAVISDSKIKNLLFVGAFRDNEVEDDHPLAVHAAQIEEKKAITRIHLKNFDLETTNEMISRIMELQPNSTEPLAEIVQRKTNGNVFFVLQFFQMLQDEGYLHFSLTTYHWTWDLDEINSNTSLADNVVDLVADKIRRMSPDVQEVLKLAAALWSSFNLQLLGEVAASKETSSDDTLHQNCTVSTKKDIVDLLEIATEEGLLDKLSDNRYKFAHDRIQQAAYSLIPPGHERDLLHRCIGDILCRITETPRREEWMYFAAAEQMNRGFSAEAVQGRHIDLEKLSSLNLQAAEKAIALSAFESASSYLTRAIEYLPSDTKWDQHYSLCLQLHEMLAETEHCIGDPNRTKAVADEVLAHAVSFQDKIEVYHTLCSSSFSAGKRSETMSLCLCIQRQLGEPFPNRGEKATVYVWSRRLKRITCGMTDEDLLALPPMKNEEKMASIRFCQIMQTSLSFQGMMRKALLVTMKMMMLSLHYGVSELTPLAYVSWGENLVGEGNIKEGYRFGKLALKLAKRLGSELILARVTSHTCTFLNHWKEPLQQQLDPVLKSHTTGMLNGDTTYAFLAILSYQSTYFFSGLPLAPGVSDFMAFADQMKEYKQHLARRSLLPMLQLMHNLMGRSKNVLILTGEIMDQSEYESLSNPHQIGVQALVSCRMQLAYYFEDIDLAEQLSKRLQTMSKNSQFAASFLVCVRSMFFGLISIALARKTRKRKHAANALRTIMEIESRWVKSGALNCLHKLLLLKAEYATLKSTQRGHVKEAFETAISTARRGGFLQDEALANERAGSYFLQNGDTVLASSFLSRGHELYKEWGALAKVAQLEKRYGGLLQGQHEEHGSYLRGRERFSAEAYRGRKVLGSCTLAV